MTLLIWFAIGLALIIAIARYNESNKLFWILLCSYIGSFTVGTIVKEMIDTDENKAKVTQMYSTQEVSNSLHFDAVTGELLTPSNESSNLVGKIAFAPSNYDFTFNGRVYNKSRGQPSEYPIKILHCVIPYDTS